MVGVLLAEPNCVLRLGFRSVLANEASVAIAAEAIDTLQFLRAFMAIPHEVVLVSLVLLQDIGLRTLNQLRHARPTSRLLVHGYDTDVGYAAEAMRFGASGFLSNGAGVAELGVAIATVATGQAYIGEAMGEELAAHVCFHADQVDQADLSGTESQVAKLLATGLDLHGIALRLDMRPAGVALHKASILRKMCRPGMNELLRCAVAKSL